MNISLFEEANNALDGGDANKAFHIFMQDAKNGGTDSWNSVGFLYDHGRGVKKTAGSPFNGIAWRQARDILLHVLTLVWFTRIWAGKDWPGSGSRKPMLWVMMMRHMSWEFCMRGLLPDRCLPAGRLDIFWRHLRKDI